MNKVRNGVTRAANRRSFIRKGITAIGSATVVAELTGDRSLYGQGEKSGTLTKGDAAILRFLAAAQIIETDLWQQYNELGGLQDDEIPGGSGNQPYTAALANLDEDMAQYIHDNTDDEISHFKFINAYLVSKGADPVSLEAFRTLPSSKATGAENIGRLTNLMQLTVDTSWYTRYRSANNPDLDHAFVFPNAVPDLAKGQHPAIPRDDRDLMPQNHIQAIANTAAFHFCFIEQGGTSLYPALAQRVSSPEVLQILLSIGLTETAHFQTWHDKAGNAVNDPLAPLTDGSLTFPNLNQPPRNAEFQTNLIMPEPCYFLSRDLPRCSIVRPTQTKGAAMAALMALTKDGLFIGQSAAFFGTLRDLAENADAASRDA